jgi:hypothetical protein
MMRSAPAPARLLIRFGMYVVKTTEAAAAKLVA